MKSVRELETFKDLMLKYHGEIKRLVDAAKIVCNEHASSMCDCKKCPFTGTNDEYCIVDIIAEEMKVD
jgi:hypothetical protein